MTENPRTTTARDHDDHELIDGAVAGSEAGAVVGSAGGHLQTDIGSQDDLKQGLGDSGSTTRPQKADDIANDQAYDSDR
ncbi:MAG: hypothetical protein JWN21_1160 [Sphingomonas bacterium]|uniref:hypothetical protein n=1 Tax=Sphingomonas bacterium TaxID=1895847 RepID=UPI00261E886D|nr:hypothetical protein [Sphingomonas bacterium]MDB5695617.1 hypothetical protein [Sphingomonas bacterium]